MKYVRLGRTDLRISQICLGGMSFGSANWMVNSEDAKKILTKALDMGINYIDTAKSLSVAT